MDSLYRPGEMPREYALRAIEECKRFVNESNTLTQTIYRQTDKSSIANDAASQSPASESTFTSQNQEMAESIVDSQSTSNYASPDSSHEQTAPIKNSEILCTPKKEPTALKSQEPRESSKKA